MEQHMSADILQLTTVKDTILAAATLISKGSPELVKLSDNDFKSYGKYKFPSAFEDVKLEDLGKKPSLSKEDVAELLKEHNKVVEAYNNQSNKK